MPTTTPSTIHCPLEQTTVDVERCARCAWRNSSQATCFGSERADAFHWRDLLHRAGV